MKRRFFFTLCLLSALIAPAAHARQEPKPLRISYVRAPFNLQLMVMKEKGILQKHLEPLGLQAQWPEITSGAKQAQALASGDLDIGGVMNTASVLIANGEGTPVRIIAGVARPTDVFAIVAAKGGPHAVADLKGKTVAGPKGTVLHQLLAAALAREGMSMLIVTHEMEFAAKVADRIIFMDQGHIIEESTPDKFFTKPESGRAQQFLSGMDYSI